MSTKYQKGDKHPKWKGGRYKNHGYWKILKPHCVFTLKDGYVREHRYIMYIYLSILNNKIVYIPKDMEVHHMNGIKTDNRISNLVLMTKPNHTSITARNMIRKIADRSNRFCKICNQKTKAFKDNIPVWYGNKIDGWICNACELRIKRKLKKILAIS